MLSVDDSTEALVILIAIEVGLVSRPYAQLLVLACLADVEEHLVVLTEACSHHRPHIFCHRRLCLHAAHDVAGFSVAVDAECHHRRIDIGVWTQQLVSLVQEALLDRKSVV